MLGCPHFSAGATVLFQSSFLGPKDTRGRLLTTAELGT
jgi:hypothetical protein